jgi:hypothetical protein
MKNNNPDLAAKKFHDCELYVWWPGGDKELDDPMDEKDAVIEVYGR